MINVLFFWSPGAKKDELFTVSFYRHLLRWRGHGAGGVQRGAGGSAGGGGEAGGGRPRARLAPRLGLAHARGQAGGASRRQAGDRQRTQVQGIFFLI
jgi:hypothetical protein